MSSTKFSILALITLLASNIYLGLIYKWYLTKPFFDTASHFLGGFFVAMLIYSFYQNEFKKTSPLFQFIGLIGITAAVGVFWEFIEYIGNQTLVDFFYNKFQTRVYFIGNLDDTIGDLLMDILGALAFWTLSHTRKPHS